MNTQNNMEERLWDYIDGLSSTSEKTTIDELVAGNAEWREKYNELFQAHQLLQSTELDQPSMRFTKNVMDEIARMHISPAAKSYINNNVIRGLAFFFITMVIGFLVYGFGQVDWSSKGDSKFSFDMSKVNMGVFFNNNYVNGFMMVNVVLGLFLLDRYLANKRKKYQEES